MGSCSMNDLECYVRWRPCQRDSESSRSRLRDNLESRKDAEPGLQGLHRVSLAYLCFLSDDESGCERHLEDAERVSEDPRPEDPTPVDLTFLIAAMRLHLMRKFRPNVAEEQKKLLELWSLWQQPPVQATCWGAKGSTLLSFGRDRNAEAMDAFRRAMVLEHEAGLPHSFHWVYGLALAMARERRESDLSGEIGEEKVELWTLAKKILDDEGKSHPVFLAKFAEAVAYSARHFRLCEGLADEAVRLAGGQEKCFMVYVTCPKVYRGLKKVAKWNSVTDAEGVVLSLSRKELQVLQVGESVFNQLGGHFLRNDFAFQFALYYIKVKDAGDGRIESARLWLSKVNPKNIWASLRLLALDESQPLADIDDILRRYKELSVRAQDEIGDNAKNQIEFEIGRFLLLEFQSHEGIDLMKSAIKSQTSIRFISNYKRDQIMRGLSAIAASKEITQWFADKLNSSEQKRSQTGLRWRLACSDCAKPRDVLHSRFQVLSNGAGLHKCTESLFLVTHQDASDSVWSSIRAFRTGNRGRQIALCKTYRPTDAENECRRSECDGAHSDEELQLWQLEQQGRFSFRSFLKQVRLSRQPSLLKRRGSTIVFAQTGGVPRKPPKLPRAQTSLCASHFAERWPKVSVRIPGPCPNPGSCEFAHSPLDEQLWNRLLRKHRDLSGTVVTDAKWQHLLRNQLVKQRQSND